VTPAVWIVSTILVLANAFYVSAEFGAVGVRKSRIHRLSDDGNGLAKRLLPFIETPLSLSRYVAASQMGITVSSLVLGAYAQATIASALVPTLMSLAGFDVTRARSVADITVLLILAVIQAVLGELVPKSLALQFPTEVALATVLPMRWSLRAFRPFIAVINGATRFLLRLVGGEASPQRHLHSPDEIELLIAESHDGGLLESDEQQRLRRALRLGRRSARDLMVPLSRLTMLSVDLGWNDVVSAVVASPFSRIPVFRGERQDIVGTLRVKDLVRRYVTHGPTDLKQLIRPIVRVREDVPADRVATVLREKRVHQCVVVDQTDTPVGLLTIQDVLEALVGAGVSTSRA
jgi:CBS domain containing-hemolysin-like protein